MNNSDNHSVENQTQQNSVESQNQQNSVENSKQQESSALFIGLDELDRSSSGPVKVTTVADAFRQAVIDDREGISKRIDAERKKRNLEKMKVVMEESNSTESSDVGYFSKEEWEALSQRDKARIKNKRKRAEQKAQRRNTQKVNSNVRKGNVPTYKRKDPTEKKKVASEADSGFIQSEVNQQLPNDPINTNDGGNEAEGDDSDIEFVPQTQDNANKVLGLHFDTSRIKKRLGSVAAILGIIPIVQHWKGIKAEMPEKLEQITWVAGVLGMAFAFGSLFKWQQKRRYQVIHVKGTDEQPLGTDDRNDHKQRGEMKHTKAKEGIYIAFDQGKLKIDIPFLGKIRLITIPLSKTREYPFSAELLVQAMHYKNITPGMKAVDIFARINQAVGSNASVNIDKYALLENKQMEHGTAILATAYTEHINYKFRKETDFLGPLRGGGGLSPTDIVLEKCRSLYLHLSKKMSKLAERITWKTFLDVVLLLLALVVMWKALRILVQIWTIHLPRLKVSARESVHSCLNVIPSFLKALKSLSINGLRSIWYRLVQPPMCQIFINGSKIVHTLDGVKNSSLNCMNTLNERFQIGKSLANGMLFVKTQLFLTSDMRDKLAIIHEFSKIEDAWRLQGIDSATISTAAKAVEEGLTLSP